ncbi:MAG: CDP-glucose 4,6-dehydratase [Gaiellaceae bacterium]
MEVVAIDRPFWSGRRVFVTGHTGFKGGWLCLWLSLSGAEVVGYSDGIPTRPSLYEEAAIEELVSTVWADVRDRDRLGTSLAASRPEVVFHLAAQPLVRRSLAEPVETYETNVIGTLNLLEAVRTTESVRAVVVVTTDKVYAEAPTRRHSEDDPLGGSDPYSSSKACAELVVAAYRKSYFGGAGVSAIATARAGNVVGGGDWAADRLVPDLVAALADGRHAEIRYPDAVRPWQHVLNPLDGYLALAERLWRDPSASRAWNFGPATADSRSVRWIVEQVAALWEAELAVLPPAEPQPPEARSLELDSTLAQEKLDWRPRWGLDDGLRATVDWYRRRLAGEDARLLTVSQIEAFATAASPAPA